MSEPMIDLTGWRVLVTGGNRGIGAACCRLFARAGAAVGIQYRSDGVRAGEVLGELARINSQPHALFHGDLTQEVEVRDLFTVVGERWERLDALVNNAGVWVHNPVRELDSALLQKTLDLNVSGPFWCVREALPLLEKSPHASIVNVTSTAGQRGEAFYSPYAASKGALISATKSWAVELAPAVRVNSVAPGWVDTEMTAEALAGEGREAVNATIPLGRVATAEDIAGSVLFLASPLARHVTGEILNVNGGSVLVG
jgi:3-oxoacyl-[acyl-carrier protein] reductase